MDFLEAEINVVLDIRRMRFQIGAREDAVLEVLRSHQLGHRLEIFGIANIRLRISKEDKDVLQAAARRRGMTLSDLLRETAVKAAQGAALA